MQLTSSFRFEANGIQRAAQAAENRAADDFITAAGRLVKVG